MDQQLRFDLPVPVQAPGVLRVWVLAAEQGPIPVDHRHLFVDARDATPFSAPSDIVLVRQRPGIFAALGSEQLGPSARAAILDHLATLLVLPDLRALRVSDVREALHIAMVPGRRRGDLSIIDVDIRSRSPFEHALLQVAARHGDDRLGTALRATRLAEKALDATTHPVVDGIFRREHGDMLTELYDQTGDLRFAEAALPAYALAASAFDRIGLDHQTRWSRRGARRMRSVVEQPWLSDLPKPKPPKEQTLGYAVRRLCGFAITLEAPDSWYAPTTTVDAAHVPLGEIELDDQDVIAALTGAASPRRRAVAVVERTKDHLHVRAGLCGEMHAMLGNLPEDVDQIQVAAIGMECTTLTFETRPWIFRPARPVEFTAMATADVHELALRIAMVDEDDLVLHFQLDASTPRRHVFF